jgi:hypothetical protein
MRHFIVTSPTSGGDRGLQPIGTRADIIAALARRNTAPEREGEDTLYGPGIVIELSPGQDPVLQMILFIDDEDIAWQVIPRLARELQWRLVDDTTGREMVFGR